MACPDPVAMIANYTLVAGNTTTLTSSVCQCKTAAGFTAAPLGGTCINAAALNTAMAAYGSSSGPVTLTVSHFTIELLKLTIHVPKYYRPVAKSDQTHFRIIFCMQLQTVT